jgi:uncharacterized protein involved in type VI secretion and phage assembly
MPGVVAAVVKDVNDPDHLGRVRVVFPWLSDSFVSDWARMTQFGAGKQRGASFLPEVDDEVMVAFEQGDFRRPVVIGSVHNGVDRPNLGDGLIDGSTGAVKRRGVISRAGHALVFLDDDGDSGVALMTGDRGLRISLNKSSTTVKISSSGQIKIEGSGDVSVKAGGGLALEAGAKLSLKGASVAITGNADVSVSGQPIKLN